MPSPLRKKKDSSSPSGGGSVAYTRWEAVESDEHASLQIPFSEFEEEEPEQQHGNNNNNVSNISGKLQAAAALGGSKIKAAFSNGHAGHQQRPRQQHVSRTTVRSTEEDTVFSLPVLSFAAKVLVVLIIFGVGWIFGFLVRWGIHTYYIDALGHCQTPSPYEFSPYMAKWAMDEVNYTNIRRFIDEFTHDKYHRPGSNESRLFAEAVRKTWEEDFGLQKVEVEEVRVGAVPDFKASSREVTIEDERGNVVERIELTEKNSAEVTYTASAISKGPLVYAHRGQLEDFSDLTKGGTNFTGAVALIRIGAGGGHPTAAAAVRTAAHFGAAAAVLFPDPLEYADVIQGDTALSRLVKSRPGDPSSPYFALGGDAVPDIPVVSVSMDLAIKLVANYTSAKGAPDYMRDGLPLATDEERKFKATIEVEVSSSPGTLYNVIGSIPGRYEPTRYVLIGSHHDTWSRGPGKPANAHSVLMEMARVLGRMFQHGWRPGRSIVFASWDGEELGGLGSTAWMNRHAKELQSRAVAYVNLDHRGDSDMQVEASPIFTDLIELAARSVECDQGQYLVQGECSLLDEWLKAYYSKTGKEEWKIRSSSSPFQNILGVSTIDVSLKNLEDVNSAIPLHPTGAQIHRQAGDGGLVDVAKHFFDFQYRYFSRVTRFALVLVLRLTSSPDAPLSAAVYGQRMHRDLHLFTSEVDRWLREGGEEEGLKEISDAMDKLERATERFHRTYDNSSRRLELLGHHEFSDQMMEMERAMLVNVWGGGAAGEGGSSCPHPLVATSMQRHALYGPSPLDGSVAIPFPRLAAAIRIARSLGGGEGQSKRNLWMCVRREMFFVTDALDSATCVLDNHLVYTYPETDNDWIHHH